jgi:hypothetical protein
MLTDPSSEAAADAMSTDESSDSGPELSNEALEEIQRAEEAVASQPNSYDAHSKVLSWLPNLRAYAGHAVAVA